jgi:hypothetical protein
MGSMLCFCQLSIYATRTVLNRKNMYLGWDLDKHIETCGNLTSNLLPNLRTRFWLHNYLFDLQIRNVHPKVPYKHNVFRMLRPRRWPRVGQRRIPADPIRRTSDPIWRRWVSKHNLKTLHLAPGTWHLHILTISVLNVLIDDEMPRDRDL